MRYTLEAAQNYLKVVHEEKRKAQVIIDFDGSGGENDIRLSIKCGDISAEEFKMLGKNGRAKSKEGGSK